MASSNKRKRKKDKPAPEVPPGTQINEELEPVKTESLTALVGEALRTGVSPIEPPGPPEIPGEDQKLRVGDPDVDPLENEFSGEEVPGATTPTPDQSNVDDIGRAYGLNEEDSGELQTSEELRARRDRKRAELIAPKKPGQL